MDDGHRRRDCHAVRINTHAFNLDELKRLAKTLWDCYQIEARIHRVTGEQYVLYIASRYAGQFCDIIRPYVPPCMEYKLL